MVSIIDRIIGTPPVADTGSLLARAQTMLDWRLAEREELDKIHNYWRGDQAHPLAPSGSKAEVMRLASRSRINIMDIVVRALSQTLRVEGYRGKNDKEDAPAWEIWQRNKVDALQSGIVEAALAYGTSYVTVMPGRDPVTGEDVPTIRGYSPRDMTALYGEDPDWPVRALAAEPNGNKWLYRMFDMDGVHYFESDSMGGSLTYLDTREYTTRLEVVPVVRFRNRIDLDNDNVGEIEQLFELQDQVDSSTFNLGVTEFFGAFPQKYAIGWTSASEEETLKASASRVWTFDDPDVKVGQFQQAQLTGYLDSRESTIRYASVIAQIPPHYLLGQMANLSAEALVAAESSLMRKSKQCQLSFGESYEQTLVLAGQIAGFPTSEDAQIRWADTNGRAFASTVDGIVKLKDAGVPLEMLFEMVPTWTQQDVERAKAILMNGDPLQQMMARLEAQAQPEPTPEAAA